MIILNYPVFVGQSCGVYPEQLISASVFKSDSSTDGARDRRDAVIQVPTDVRHQEQVSNLEPALLEFNG